MFSEATLHYFEMLPRLPGIDDRAIRASLSKAYAEILAVSLDGATEDSAEATMELLARLVNSLTVFVLSRSVSDAELTQAAAFVAAEALDLLARSAPEVSREPYEDIPRGTFHACEAALLYLIAGHDSNAAIVASGIAGGRYGRPSGVLAEDVSRLLLSLEGLCTMTRVAPLPERGASDSRPSSELARSVAMRVLAVAVADYTHWLRLDAAAPGLDMTVAVLQRISAALESNASEHSDLYELARLVSSAIVSTSRRALRNVVSPALDAENADVFADYVRSRASLRPLMWPPAQEYAERCLPGPHSHGVVSVPTGSGKGAVAELACVTGALSGWVLYLVPTNALANQVRNDLRSALADLEFFRVQAFLGGQEYTTLELEGTPPTPPGTIIVMTPEKCALALRRSPEAFSKLRGVIVDECHLLGEQGTRGVTAELVLSHIFSLNADVIALMLSALVANPGHLGRWLEVMSDRNAVSVRSPWRPTRTLRGVVGLSREGSEPAAEQAADTLSGLAARRKKVAFQAPIRLLANLQGVWGSTEGQDFALIDLPVAARLAIKRHFRGGEDAYRIDRPSDFTGRTTALLARHFVQHGFRTLAFSPRSRHDPFVLARRLLEVGNLLDVQIPALPVEVEAHVVCADYELGLRSEVAELVDSGISVHSSALLDAERHASEIAFTSGLTKLMIATGTLAQGLNLPAEAVLVAGTAMGDESTRSRQHQDRIRAQLLNAIGRAGRANVSNRGCAFVVPGDALFLSATPDVARAAEQAEFLGHEDASATIASQLAPFVRSALDGTVSSAALSIEEMTAYTYLPGVVEGTSTSEIISRSLGFWEVVGDDRGSQAQSQVAQVIQSIGEEFVRSARVPESTREVGYKTGLPLPIVFELFRSFSRRRDAILSDAPQSILDWSTEFLRILFFMSPEITASALWGSELLSGRLLSIGATSFGGTAEIDAPEEERRVAWRELNSFLLAYLKGSSLKQVAQGALPQLEDISGERASGARPIPKMIAVTRALQERLSLLAGGLTALVETPEFESTLEFSEAGAWSLQRLPIALRSGCGTSSSLAWFRFGLRYRRPAHLMGRAFPIPDALSDEETADWVRRTRRSWIQGEALPARGLDDGERGVLEAVRRIVSP